MKHVTIEGMYLIQSRQAVWPRTVEVILPNGGTCLVGRQRRPLRARLVEALIASLCMRCLSVCEWKNDE